MGGVLLTTEEQRLLAQAYHALDLAEIAARPQGASAMQTHFPTELGTCMRRAVAGGRRRWF